MRKSEFTEDQIAFALEHNELGTSVDEVCRKMGIREAMFYSGRRSTAASGRPSNFSGRAFRWEPRILHDIQGVRPFLGDARRFGHDGGHLSVSSNVDRCGGLWGAA